MRHIKLIACSDEYDSELGFKIEGTPDFEEFMAAREGLLIAHDIIEHQNGIKNMGPVWDELEALGAIWYVRGQWGDMMTLRPNYHSPQVSVASGVTRMFSSWQSEGGYLGPNGLRVGSRPSDYDEDFREITSIAAKDIRAEVNEEFDPHELREYLTLALHRMRAGFRKAQRRFERDGSSRFYAGNLFCAIRDAVGEAVKQIEYEGQEFRLSYGGSDARCVALYDEEY